VTATDRRPAGVRRWLALAPTCLVLTETTSPQRRQLTASPQLSAGYDAIFDARFDDVPAMLAKTCEAHPDGARVATRTPQAPPEACQLLEVVSIWWRIQLDPNNRSHDDEFRMRADAAIAAIEAWTTREPMRAEAWFYLGGAYGTRAQWRVLRGERLAAARDGKRIKDALERAVMLDPNLQDAYFGIGLYHYYADIAPTAAKVLRWLLLLPGGNRVEGLQEMLRAREGGELLRSEADYQLHLIYLWYEKQPERALDLLRSLHARHPRNPHFLQLIAEVEDVYLHDAAASLRSWQQLFEAAQGGRVAEAGMADAIARLGMARQLDRRLERDAAIARVRELLDRNPSAPFGIVARAQLLLGQVLDHRGQRSDAIAAYRAALENVPPGDPDRVAPAARAGLRSPTQ